MKINYYLGNIKTQKEAAAFIMTNRLHCEHISVDTFNYPVTIPVKSIVSYEEDGRARTLIESDNVIYETTSKDVYSIVELAAVAHLKSNYITLDIEEFLGANGAGRMLRGTLLYKSND